MRSQKARRPYHLSRDSLGPQGEGTEEPSGSAVNSSGKGLPTAGGRALDHPAELVSVYVAPARIQRGWGDVVELFHAIRALQGLSVEFCTLSAVKLPPGYPPRNDPRVIPVDPEELPSGDFPVIPWSRDPRRGDRAVVLVTWWGVSGDRTSRAGDGISPGPYAAAVAQLRKEFGEDRVLLISLEEFAACQDSATSRREVLRQAGRRSSPDNDWQRRYRDAYRNARGAEEPRVLHLFGTFAEERGARREFPFMIPVGPFGWPTQASLRKTEVAHPGRKKFLVAWYATSESAPLFLRKLVEDLPANRDPIEFEVRTEKELEDAFRRLPLPEGITLRVLPRLPLHAWERKVRDSDLVIVGGSQSLVDVLRIRVPFLYFNGFLGSPGEPARAFRREKLRSLVNAWKARGVSGRVLRDLSDFADARRTSTVLLRALGDAEWRREELAPLSTEAVPWALPAARRDGDAYLRRIVERWSRYPEGARSFVEQVRREV